MRKSLPFLRIYSFAYRLLFLFGITLSLPALSQGSSAKNVFLELGGNAILLSLNYDQRFSDKNYGLGGRAGVGVSARSKGHGMDVVVLIPVGINYLIGHGPHHLEAGAGVTFGHIDIANKGDNHDPSVAFVPSLGYRYQPLTGGATIRLFASPFFASSFQFWAGLSIGIRFR